MPNLYKKLFPWLCNEQKARIFLAFLCFCFSLNAFSLPNVKNSDLSGKWYSSNSYLLKLKINNYLSKAKLENYDADIVALIVPHAGLSYSGQSAAYAFKAVKKKKISTVIVVGFSHRANYDGIAVLDYDGLRTPLGVLACDRELADKIVSLNKKIYKDNLAFDNENSVEMILPFAQIVFKDAKVLLLAIGKQSYENSQLLGEALAELVNNRQDILIVASTDMSHYLPKPLASKTDDSSESYIKAMDPESLYKKCYGQNRMCGTGAVVAVMIAAKKLGADKVHVLNRSNSARTNSDKEKVVGYLSAAFVNSKRQTKKEERAVDNIISEQNRKDLLSLARKTLSLYVNEGETLQWKNDNPTFDQVTGVFVTLHKNKRLRGCVGNIIGRKPLYQGVIDMAISASEDHRFPKVSKDELDKIDIEISMLTPLKKIDDPDKIIMGKHGVLVKSFFKSGVYLPQVATETGWTRDEFMNSLCGQKAGMEADAWKTGKCEIYIFSAEVFGEKD
jgi:MEMO1 family protein